MKGHLCGFVLLPVWPRLPITWGSTPLQNLSIAGTYSAIPETLQGTLEHQTPCNTYKYTYLHDKMRGKIQPTYFQGWPWTWTEVGSKLGIVDYKSLAYWFISSRNLSHNHYGILNKKSLKARFSAIGRPSRIVNSFTSASQPSYAAKHHDSSILSYIS